VREFVLGSWLGADEIRAIVEDVVRDRLSDVELAALVVAAVRRGLSVEEAYHFSRAMVETGERLELGVKPVVDKHSIGGVPGDKTTLLAVPMLAALGYYIPKTSSRAITSPAGTADRAEVLMPVNLSLEEIRRVVLKTGGCIAWGGALRLAPADDKIIRVEHPLSIDPFLVPSIMAKKAAVGATHVVLDIPVGRGGQGGHCEGSGAAGQDVHRGGEEAGDAHSLRRDLRGPARRLRSWSRPRGTRGLARPAGLWASGPR
jgi:AMP phosphorylase (EC 2.4.2.-)